MPKPPLPEHVGEILARPNPAVIATIRADGQPILVATWYRWLDGRVLVNLEERRKRLDRLRVDPRVTLTAFAGTDWSTYISLQGRVTEFRDDTDLGDIDWLARHYTGQPYGVRDQPRITALMEIERWHGWGKARS